MEAIVKAQRKRCALFKRAIAKARRKRCSLLKSLYSRVLVFSQVRTRILSTPSTVHMLLPRIQFPHDGNLYPAWLLLAWKLLSFYHVEIAFQDASPGLGLQHAWCLFHHGEFLIMQSFYKIICQMTGIPHGAVVRMIAFKSEVVSSSLSQAVSLYL